MSENNSKNTTPPGSPPTQGRPDENHTDENNHAQWQSDVRARKSLDDALGRSLEQLSSAFKASARRWELIVYPSLFAFILLAAYGFYLIYNLTSDVNSVATHMDLITKNMQEISNDMHIVSKNMIVMTQTVDSQSISMREMSMSMRNMDASMSMMRYDLAVMNNSVSRPMQFMNTFMPW